MKKFAVLTSVLVLASCGGGSGGGSETPGTIVMPDSARFSRVDSDTGLGMLDINKTRTDRYSQAIETAQSIENESDIDATAAIARTANVNRTAKIPNALNNTSSNQDINKAYEAVSDIFLNKDLKDYKNHDILVALALVLVDKSHILEVLKYNKGDNLDAKIQNLISDLKDQKDNVKEIVDGARGIYQDFGKEFDLTLKDAVFYLNSNDSNWYTFSFDEEGNLIGLKEKDDTIVEKDKNGAFIKDHINGYEYTFAFDGKAESINATFGGKIDKFYETKPTAEQLKEDLLAAVRLENTNWPEEVFDEIESILDDATIYSFKNEKKEEIKNNIVGRHADYVERVRIETGSKDLGLKYSDFGLRYEEVEFNQEDDLIAAYGLKHYLYTEHGGFIGGYEDKRTAPTDKMTFKGDAYVGLTRKQGDDEIEDSDKLMEPSNKYYKGTSEFVVKKIGDTSDLEQKLIADFSNAGWYKVTVDNMAFDHTGGTFLFENNTGKEIDEAWRADPENQDGKMENMNIKYYGPESDNPTEAVGFVQYIENKKDSGDWTFKADITFGAKKE